MEVYIESLNIIGAAIKGIQCETMDKKNTRVELDMLLSEVESG